MRAAQEEEGSNTELDHRGLIKAPPPSRPCRSCEVKGDPVPRRRAETTPNTCVRMPMLRKHTLSRWHHGAPVGLKLHHRKTGSSESAIEKAREYESLST